MSMMKQVSNGRLSVFKCNTMSKNKCIEIKNESGATVSAYLVSYETMVASYSHETKKMTVYGWYSATTMRHINSFLSHFGYEKMTKKQVESGEQPKLLTSK